VKRPTSSPIRSPNLAPATAPSAQSRARDVRPVTRSARCRVAIDDLAVLDRDRVGSEAIGRLLSLGVGRAAGEDLASAVTVVIEVEGVCAELLHFGASCVVGRALDVETTSVRADHRSADAGRWPGCVGRSCSLMQRVSTRDLEPDWEDGEGLLRAAAQARAAGRAPARATCVIGSVTRNTAPPSSAL
jgi:hypothetical protein